jgi:hypothetical protein
LQGGRGRNAFKAAFTRGWLHLPVMLAGALAKELWGLRRRRRPVRRETFATFRRLKRQPEEAPPPKDPSPGRSRDSG